MALQQVRKTACSIYDPIGQQTVLALLNPSSGAYALLTPLPLTAWHILSFDAANAVICIQIDAPSGSRVISITLDINAIENSQPSQPLQNLGVRPTGQYLPPSS